MNFEDVERRKTEKQENVKGNSEVKKKRFPLPVGAQYHASSIIPPHLKNFHLLLSPLRYVANILLFVVLVRSVVVRSQWTNSVPAQAVLAHDRRRDALLSYAAAVRAVAAVATTSRSATAVAATS